MIFVCFSIFLDYKLINELKIPLLNHENLLQFLVYTYLLKIVVTYLLNKFS